MRILRIGDPHIKPSNLEECEKLMHFINDKILELKPDRVEILGDLFHTHAIVRLETLDFWDSWLDVLSEACELVVLVGNHDMASNREDAPNALLAFKHIKKKNLKIAHLPRVEGIYAYIPYYHDNEKFIEVANTCVDNGAKVIICHATFDGSKYESGTYAPNGIDIKRLKCKTIISGHIHSKQTIKADDQIVYYPGTPKWDTLSDANEDKGIWLYEHDDITGEVLSEQIFRTGGVVTKIISLVWIEGEPLEAIPSGCRVCVELIGSSDWVNQQKAALKGSVEIKTKITDRVDRSERKTGTGFEDFLKNLYISTADRKGLVRIAKEIGIV